jgi:hypothetical protein
MGVKPVAVAAFVASAFVSAPSNADEIINQQITTPLTMFYVSIPLGGSSAKERAPAYGFALQGKRQYETLYVDTRTLSAFEGALAGIEAKWLIAGAVVVGAGAYAVSKDRSRSTSYSSSQNQQQQNSPPQQPAPPGCDPNDPCKK